MRLRVLPASCPRPRQRPGRLPSEGQFSVPWISASEWPLSLRAVADPRPPEFPGIYPAAPQKLQRPRRAHSRATKRHLAATRNSRCPRSLPHPRRSRILLCPACIRIGSNPRTRSPSRWPSSKSHWQRDVPNAIRPRRSLQQESGGDFWSRMHVQKSRSSKRQRSRFIQENGVHLGEFLKVQAALDNRALLCGSSNRSKDCQRRSRSDTASSRHNDHGNRRANVVSDEECQDCGGKSKIDEVSGQTIRNALNRRTGLLGLFHGLDDLAESCVTPKPFDAHFERAGLVDRAGVYLLSWVFLHRHRFASDGCLIDKGMAAHHRTIHRNSASRLDENNVTHQHLLNPQLSPSSALIHRCSGRQQIDQVANRVPPAAHGEPLEDFRHEHEQSDHQCRENFPDRQRRQNRDGHREFHRHLPFENILNRFAEYRVSANDGANYAGKDKMKTRVYSPKPKYARCDRHKADSNGLAPIQTMLVRRAATLRVARRAFPCRVSARLMHSRCHTATSVF